MFLSVGGCLLLSLKTVSFGKLGVYSSSKAFLQSCISVSWRILSCLRKYWNHRMGVRRLNYRGVWQCCLTVKENSSHFFYFLYIFMGGIFFSMWLFGIKFRFCWWILIAVECQWWYPLSVGGELSYWCRGVLANRFTNHTKFCIVVVASLSAKCEVLQVLVALGMQRMCDEQHALPASLWLEDSWAVDAEVS